MRRDLAMLRKEQNKSYDVIGGTPEAQEKLEKERERRGKEIWELEERAMELKKIIFFYKHR